MAVWLSGLGASLALRRRKIPGTQFCYRLYKPQSHSAPGWIRQIKEEKSNELVRNRTRDHTACSIVPQPTTLRREQFVHHLYFINTRDVCVSDLAGSEHRIAKKQQTFSLHNHMRFGGGGGGVVRGR
jgi:hypothetical protein